MQTVHSTTAQKSSQFWCAQSESVLRTQLHTLEHVLQEGRSQVPTRKRARLVYHTRALTNVVLSSM